jgi:hypothetical protein
MKPKTIEKKDPQPKEAPIEEPNNPSTDIEQDAPAVGEERAP